MVTQLQSSTPKDIIYPDSDGQLMADNTKQFELIVLIKKNLDLLVANDPNVFVAGDLLWYPVEGDNITRKAPDIMVAFGRPKGDRGSYRQWQEDNIPPQVVFEILSPGNTVKEMISKYKFYERYGVEEYYLYDPESYELEGWLRQDQHLTKLWQMDGWTSPRLRIRFATGQGELVIYRPDGQRFLTSVELQQQAEQAQLLLQQERLRAEQLAAYLRSLGVDPDNLP